jgi:hypothetical protein
MMIASYKFNGYILVFSNKVGKQRRLFIPRLAVIMVKSDDNGM